MENLKLNMKKQRNYSLDLLKFISSFLIVCIHFKISGKTGELITIIARFAVPVFFMVSGYYSYNDDEHHIKNKILNILKLYFFACVIYFCYTVAVKMLSGQVREALLYVSTYLRPRYVLPAILFNESNTAMHLWFLGSLLYSYLIQWCVVKFKIKDNIVYILSCALLLIHIALGIGLSVIGIETPDFLAKNYMLRNFLFMGFPLFALGQFMRKKEDVLLKEISTIHIISVFILSMAEAFIMNEINWEKELYLGSILLGFILFVAALKLEKKEYNPNLVKLFNTSTIVYLIHVMIGDILAHTSLENMLFYQYTRPFIIFVISVIIALVLNKVSEKDKK